MEAKEGEFFAILIKRKAEKKKKLTANNVMGGVDDKNPRTSAVRDKAAGEGDSGSSDESPEKPQMPSAFAAGEAGVGVRSSDSRQYAILSTPGGPTDRFAQGDIGGTTGSGSASGTRSWRTAQQMSLTGKNQRAAEVNPTFIILHISETRTFHTILFSSL